MTSFLAQFPIYQSEEKRDGLLVTYVEFYRVTDMFFVVHRRDTFLQTWNKGINGKAEIADIWSELIREIYPLIFDEMRAWIAMGNSLPIKEFHFIENAGSMENWLGAVVGELKNSHLLYSSRNIRLADSKGQLLPKLDILFGMAIPVKPKEPLIIMGHTTHESVVPKTSAGEVKRLIDELVQIGKNTQSRSPGRLYVNNARVREIGKQLDEIGDIWLMRLAWKRVMESLGRSQARDLERSWHGIGKWLC